MAAQQAYVICFLLLVDDKKSFGRKFRIFWLYLNLLAWHVTRYKINKVQSHANRPHLFL